MDVLGSGAVVGLIAGAISGSGYGAFMLFFVFAGGLSMPAAETLFPPPPVAPKVGAPLPVICLLLGLCIGVLLGSVFSYFHQSTDDHVPIRHGFKYGVVLAVLYTAIGVQVVPWYLNLFHLAIFYASTLVMPTLLFGLFLVWIWNWNWQL